MNLFNRVGMLGLLSVMIIWIKLNVNETPPMAIVFLLIGWAICAALFVFSPQDD